MNRMPELLLNLSLDKPTLSVQRLARQYGPQYLDETTPVLLMLIPGKTELL